LGTGLDIIILGTGPAASAAAITAADAGLRVAMIAHAKKKTDLCDEPLQSIHPGLETLLASLGAEQAITYAAKGSYEGILTAGEYQPLSTIEDERWKGHHISKFRFDDYLAFCVRKRTVEIIDGDDVTGLTPGRVSLRSDRCLNTRYIIDASGRARIAGKMLKVREQIYSPPLTTWSGVAHEIPNNIATSLQTAFIPESFGWTWLAPHLTNSCTWTRLAVTKREKLTPPDLLVAAGYHSPVISASMRWRLFNRLVLENHILLAGDAAGLLDPAAGQGILRACWSGIMAARSVVAIINSGVRPGVALDAYEDWFNTDYHRTAAKLKSHYEQLGIIFPGNA